MCLQKQGWKDSIMTVMDADTKIEAPNWVEAPETLPPKYSTIEAAVELVLTPETYDANQERINKEIRAIGLKILGEEENKELFDKYLGEGKKRAKLVEVLMNNFEQDSEPFDKPRLGNPLGFATILSVLAGLGLEHAKSDEGQRIYRLAKARSMEDDFKEYLAERSQK